MSKMKHLLRKLHIGDHNHHARPPTDPSPTIPSTSSSSTSPSSDLPKTTPSSETESSSVNNNFNFFEEEFQMQLALAISVSDQGQSSVDSEIAQIDAAKQISLGCSPSQTLPDSLSLRYWNNDVVNYDEKIVDGFYDVCGVDSNLVVQSKMPSLVDLEAIPVSGDAGYEVVVINRAVDVELRHLEESVYLMSTEYRALDRSRNTSILVQKLADLIVQRMGGPVTDVEEIIRKWRIRNHDLRVYSDTIMLPLGSLDVGHSRQRALLFKVLADRIGLPCKLVKGSYYTGTDEGAVNLIKLDSGSEYIIDLMGAPGTLIPSEVPSSHHQSFGLDGRSLSTSYLGAGTRLSQPCADETVKLSNSSAEQLPTGLLSNDTVLASGRKRSAEGLGENKLIMDIAGHKLSVNTSSKQDLAQSRNDDMNPNNGIDFFRDQVGFSGNEEAMKMVCGSQFDTNNIHNAQIDHAINGVAEILWEDLHIGERIGIGSYGEVYHGEWNGTEVAVKKFMKQDISGTALAQFRCEIEIMMRLRHPNVVLFMGAVMRPPNMSILTEFLPRGSLYKLLHRSNGQIDEKKRIKMALDVAKGMNYLHTSTPIIVHRDLKTPNLLVDKNWVVKVCDFGMSRLQHNTFLSSKSAAGTAEWMAPEVLRNEPSNEKSDIYSFGVILWELATLRVPWTEMNSMQVVGAVGWQGRHLDIPPSVEPTVAEIISECWNRNPQMRPSFAEIISRIKGLECLTVQRLENPLNYQ